MNLRNKTVREIAVGIPASIKVFEELNIDYCCGGRVDFAEACEKAEVSTDIVEEKIANAVASTPSNQAQHISDQVSASKLIDLIVKKHHFYANEEIGRLTPLMAKVATKHGEAHPFLGELETEFKSLCDELIPHMQKEEMVLFPYIKDLEIAEIRGTTAMSPPFGSVQNPIRMMGIEHESAGNTLAAMRRITNDYSPPEGACPSFLALYFGLEELEKDLHRHIHLENNVLFPLAVESEEKSFSMAV